MRATTRAAAALHSTNTQQHWQKGISKDFKNLRNKLKNQPGEPKPNLCFFTLPFSHPHTKKKKTLSPNSHLLPSLPSLHPQSTKSSCRWDWEQSRAQRSRRWRVEANGQWVAVAVVASSSPFLPALPRSGCCSEWEREDSCCLRRFSGTPPSPGSGPRARDPELRVGELPCSGWEFLRSVDACWLR